MKALQLAVSLLLVPRLFASLILFPLLLSLLLVAAQLLVTRVALKSWETDLTSADHPAAETKQSSIVRLILYGNSDPRPDVIICRWMKRPLSNGGSIEVPPSKECAPDRLDAALHVSDPALFDSSQYREILNGSFERIHICESTCTPDVIIFPEAVPNRTDVHSFWGWALLYESRLSATARQDFVDKLQEIRSAQGLIGNQFLFVEGMRGAVSLRSLVYSVAMVLNLALLVLAALWLALKAHRKVLDYFSYSGVLLPLVAATGKETFYSALWMLTLARVAAFLAAAAPITIYSILDALPDDATPLFGGIERSELALWLIALCVSFGFATLIASIAELKQRHALLSFSYKFVPLLVSTAGAAIWGFTFVMSGSLAETMRDVIAALPLVGMAPILVAPILKPKITIFVLHTLLTLIALVVAARINARWFAAHLEEI